MRGPGGTWANSFELAVMALAILHVIACDRSELAGIHDT